jgi:hypothetical protein
MQHVSCRGRIYPEIGLERLKVKHICVCIKSVHSLCNGSSRFVNKIQTVDTPGLARNLIVICSDIDVSLFPCCIAALPLSHDVVFSVCLALPYLLCHQELYMLQITYTNLNIRL